MMINPTEMLMNYINSEADKMVEAKMKRVGIITLGQLIQKLESCKHDSEVRFSFGYLSLQY